MRPLRSVFLDIERHVDEVFDKLVFRPWSIRREETCNPPLDVHDTADAYLVEIDLPGVAPEDVSFVVAERSLTISGQRRPGPPAGAATLFRERQGGAFRRSLEFSEPVDPGGACTECFHGTCRIHLPKKGTAEEGAAAPSPCYIIRVTIP